VVIWKVRAKPARTRSACARPFPDHRGALDVGHRFDHGVLLDQDRPALRVQHGARHHARTARDVHPLRLQHVGAGIDRPPHGARLEGVAEILHDLPGAPANQIGGRTGEKRVHFRRIPEILKGRLGLSRAKVARRVRHARSRDLGGKQRPLGEKRCFAGRGGEEVEHLVVGQAEPAVQKERLLGARVPDVGGGIEIARPLLELRTHHQRQGRLGKCADQLLQEREGAAAESEDGPQQRERPEGAHRWIFVEAEIHAPSVEARPARVK
jgi:hypothetical protein